MEGRCEPGFEAVRDAFFAGHPAEVGGGQLCVYRRGKPVVDLWCGPFGPDSLTVMMSCTKGAVAILVHRLAERGELSLTAPISEVWPEFAAEGKGGVTLAHVLTHSSGLFGWDPDVGTDGATALDWQASVQSLAAMRPYWPPGAAYLYHFISYGFLVGEVVRRATGRTVGERFAEEIAGPLGLDFWIGLPEREDARVVPHVRSSPPFAADVLFATFEAMGLDRDDRLVRGIVATMVATDELIDLMNTRPGRAAEVPAGNGVGSARAMARLYAATIGEVDGVRLLSPVTVEAARTPRTDSLGAPPPMPMIGDDPQRFGLGFELARKTIPMAGRGSFGHPGAGGRIAFADPESGLAVGYACNGMLWDGRNPDPRWGWMTALKDLAHA